MQVEIAAARADIPRADTLGRCRNQPPEAAAAQQRAIPPLRPVELPASAARWHFLSQAFANRSSFARWAASRVRTALASACSRRVPQASSLCSGARRPAPELPAAAKPRATQRNGEQPSYYINGTPHFRMEQARRQQLCLAGCIEDGCFKPCHPDSFFIQKHCHPERSRGICGFFLICANRRFLYATTPNCNAPPLTIQSEGA